MPDGAALPILDHELANDELQWMSTITSLETAERTRS